MPGPDVNLDTVWQGSPRARRWLGASALLLVSALFAWPVVRARLRAAEPSPAETAAPAVPAETAANDPPARQLQAATDQLKQAAAKVVAASKAASTTSPDHRTRPGLVEPPSTTSALAVPAETDAATACIESFVPEGTFGRGRLDWACEQPDLWSIELDLHGRALKRGTGPGASSWVKLGRFGLGAIAVLRSACCPGAEPFIAKVPVQNCGSLVGVLTALGKEPSAGHAQKYDAVMSCLAERRVWFPEGWSRVTYKQSRQHFEEFLDSVRKRK